MHSCKKKMVIQAQQRKIDEKKTKIWLLFDFGKHMNVDGMLENS